ncbi:unnamed protein product [Spirodela intermedia]|uniref:Nudix hydrolase domain-containing protein n=1 Tax=Spirodela intermedia TaxID=51605 RepID=A0A7I8JLF3_SPIIN|nr:unnamed protein product [Spirodela intermedia]CAA6671017.1 unnamed protein product [Spirodela intermedia]
MAAADVNPGGAVPEEHFDVLTKTGEKTGTSKPRSSSPIVQEPGSPGWDYHRAVHVWIYAENTRELLLQRRADCKDSWPGLWDISSAGHISAGSSSLLTARRELEEELGVRLPEDAFEFLFVFLQESVINGGTFINNEFNDVYLVTTLDPIPLEAFTFQFLSFFCRNRSVYCSVHFVDEYKKVSCKEDEDYVPYDINGQYGQLFEIIERRYLDEEQQRRLALQKQLDRYAPIHLHAELSELSEANQEALVFIIKAAMVIDDIFYTQAWNTNQELRDWLKKYSDDSSLNKLKWMYYSINKEKAFLTTADSAIKLCGLQYRAAFPAKKPLVWRTVLHVVMPIFHDLMMVPFSQQYRPFLEKASALLYKAAEVTDCSSLSKLLKGKAEAFLSNDYYESDISWMELDSKLDVTIGPYETYEDELYGYKATFEAFIGVKRRSSYLSSQTLGDNLQITSTSLKMLLPAPIRVIRLVYNSGAPNFFRFQLPNDERIVNERGNINGYILILDSCYFTHSAMVIATDLRPHTITLPSGQKSTVRWELQELHSALEESKATLLGLGQSNSSSIRFLPCRFGLFPGASRKSMYVPSGRMLLRSVRFGLEEATGSFIKGKALQLNLVGFPEKGVAFIPCQMGVCVDFDKGDPDIQDEVTKLPLRCSQTYGIMSQPLDTALKKLEQIRCPYIAPLFFPVRKITDALS